MVIYKSINIADMEEIEIPGVDQELLKELKRIRDGIYERYRNSSALTDDWDWMNIGFLRRCKIME